jgi:predicted alpha/beta hydrolase family esterase
LSAVPIDKNNIKRPPMYLAATELLRASFEAMSLMMSSPMLAAAPRGDGHAVLVLPGFATDDHATAFLRRFLDRVGYQVHPWGLGMNFDHRTAGFRGEHVARQINRIVASTGKKLSLVGWSLGGVIAREAARRDPNSVRQVISIASPFCGNPHANHVGAVYTWLSGNRVDSPEAMRRFALGPQPLPMPSTSIYSRKDGITAWENCVAITNHQSENIEVNSSHFGMVINADVFQIVADRLAQSENAWAPYKPPIA